MTDISPLLPALPRELDGFRVEIDPAHERGDIVLDRPPLNVITMVEREQLRWASRSSTQILGCASSCSERWASISRAVARSEAFSKHPPSTSRVSPGTSLHRRAVPSRLLPSIAVIVSGSASNSRWLVISASPPRPASMRCPNSVWRKSQVRGCGAAAEDGRHQPRQGHRHAFASHHRR